MNQSFFLLMILSDSAWPRDAAVFHSMDQAIDCVSISKINCTLIGRIIICLIYGIISLSVTIQKGESGTSMNWIMAIGVVSVEKRI